MIALTPLGARDYLPEDIKKREAILSMIEGVFQSYGYQKMITPAIEYYDTLALAMGDSLDEKAVSFLDANGRHVLLRPDPTAAIARIVASRTDSLSLPIRWYYLDTVFRKDADHGYTERLQAGVECIGDRWS